MARSGYQENYRRQMIVSAVSCYVDMLNCDQAGTRPIWRPRDWHQIERQVERESRLLNWHKRGPTPGDQVRFSAPLIMDPTASGEMTDRIKKICQVFSGVAPIDIRLFLRGGSKLCQSVKAEPIGRDECGRALCESCLDADTRGGVPEALHWLHVHLQGLPKGRDHLHLLWRDL